jgi:hypothetical protein
MTATTVGVLALGVALVRMGRHGWDGTRLDVLLMLLAGFGIAGQGWLGGLIAEGGAWIAGLAESGTAQAFGVGVPLLVVIGMITLIVVDIKDRSIWKWTPWVALALPTALAVVGGIYVGAGDTVLAGIGDALTNLVGLLGSLG